MDLSKQFLPTDVNTKLTNFPPKEEQDIQKAFT